MIIIQITGIYNKSNKYKYLQGKKKGEGKCFFYN